MVAFSQPTACMLVHASGAWHLIQSQRQARVRSSDKPQFHITLSGKRKEKPADPSA